MAKIYIIFYSTYGHVYQMAKAVKEGVDSIEGCEGILYQVSCCMFTAPGYMIHDGLCTAITVHEVHASQQCKLQLSFYQRPGAFPLLDSLACDQCNAAFLQVSSRMRECVQVPETLPAEVLEKMHAAPKPDVPVITAADLPEADGFIFGFPTR